MNIKVIYNLIIVNSDQTNREGTDLESKLTRIIEKITDYCDDKITIIKSSMLIAKIKSINFENVKKSQMTSLSPVRNPCKALKKFDLKESIRSTKLNINNNCIY